MACYAPSVELRWGLLLSQEWNKAHLINHLAEVHDYRHYLELCTYTSGRRYDEIDLAAYTVDTDYGCGVIRKLAEPSLRRLPALTSSETGAASAATPWKPSLSFRRTSRFC